MPGNNDTAESLIAAAQQILAFVFSWIFLLGVSVIISGKLAAKHVVLQFGEDDLFQLNLGVFRLKARGDEVSLGFIFFVISLGLVVIAGGPQAYELFKWRAGLDIGQWNSICVIASFISIVVAACLWLFRTMSGSAPIVQKDERNAMLVKLGAPPPETTELSPEKDLG